MIRSRTQRVTKKKRIDVGQFEGARVLGARVLRTPYGEIFIN